MSKVTLASLTSELSNERRTGFRTPRANIMSESYKGLSPAQVARKAANKASNNGECWWVYKYVYTNLMYRPN